jgi:hypothetical protein
MIDLTTNQRHTAQQDGKRDPVVDLEGDVVRGGLVLLEEVALHPAHHIHLVGWLSERGSMTERLANYSFYNSRADNCSANNNRVDNRWVNNSNVNNGKVDNSRVSLQGK